MSWLERTSKNNDRRRISAEHARRNVARRLLSLAAFAGIDPLALGPLMPERAPIRMWTCE
jgi:hypothetical protein